MEMHEIKYFLAACRTLNFHRAAELSHVSQPALTRAIQKLEAELGGHLFHRERSQIRLTDFGRLMRSHLEGVRHRLVAEPEVVREVSLVSVAGRTFSPAISAFVKAVREYDWAAGAAAAGGLAR
jgi:LysR family transcriptional regulator, hydrogen peroxide-inducible genes activator